MKKLLSIILLFLLFIIKNTSAFEVNHELSITLGAFDAGRSSLSYNLTSQSYQVKSSVRTHGFFDTLYPFQANYFTTGKIIKNKLQTTDYRYASESRFNKRTKELVYNEKGIPIYRISTKNDKSKKSKINDTEKYQGTTDLQTVLAEFIKQYNELKFCDSRMEVFDGKRRFDVIFKDEGQESVQPCTPNGYFGVAAKCSMYIDKLNSDDDDLLWQLTSERPVYFWILETPETHKPFIAQIKIKSTPLGELDVCTTNVTTKE